MKNFVILFSCLLLLYCSNISGQEVVTNNNQSKENSLQILSSPDLYNLTQNWVNEYSRLNPALKIKVINFTDSKVENMVNAGADFCIISDEYNTALNNKSNWNMVIGHDVIVPIINSKNPFLVSIYQQGISPDDFAQMFKNPENQKWSNLVEKSENVPVNYYQINNESIKTSISKFLNTNQIQMDGIKIENEAGLISAIQNDPYGIGFCKLSTIFDSKSQSMVENIKLLPIDRDGNGRIDHKEKIYDDLESFTRGVWIGKYPRALSRNIYSVSSAKPTNEVQVAFLKWVVTDGQQFLNTNGYYDLVYSDRQTKVDLLTEKKVYVSSSNSLSAVQIVVLFIGGFLVLGFIVGMVFSKRSKNAGIPNATTIQPSAFNQNSVKAPNGLFFDKTHTWAYMEKDGMVKIGIDDFLLHVTGPITQIKMKNAGDKIRKGEQLLSIIQKGKQLNIYAPVSGIIKTQNSELNAYISLINHSPFSYGWVYMIEPTNWTRETQFLYMAEKYKEWLNKEFMRLKDFLAVTLNTHKVEFAQLILQDGGEIKDNILTDFGPEVWEDFQTNFINTSK
jgi:glycine cleavage system H lipoate-binding protein/ABC-type phosphate transport system substrate-binding protein